MSDNESSHSAASQEKNNSKREAVKVQIRRPSMAISEGPPANMDDFSRLEHLAQCLHTHAEAVTEPLQKFPSWVPEAERQDRVCACCDAPVRESFSSSSISPPPSSPSAPFFICGRKKGDNSVGCLDSEALFCRSCFAFVVSRSTYRCRSLLPITENARAGLIALLDGHALVQHMQEGRGISKRQTLEAEHPEVFFTDLDFLETMESAPTCLGKAKEAALFVAVSAPWYSKKEPDPQGILAGRVCERLVTYFKEGYDGRIALYWDFCSVYQPDVEGEFECEEDEYSFYAAAHLMDLFFGSTHPCTAVLRLPAVPGVQIPFHGRGWQRLETALSCQKKAESVIELIDSDDGVGLRDYRDFEQTVRVPLCPNDFAGLIVDTKPKEAVGAKMEASTGVGFFHRPMDAGLVIRIYSDFAIHMAWSLRKVNLDDIDLNVFSRGAYLLRFLDFASSKCGEHSSLEVLRLTRSSIQKQFVHQLSERLANFPRLVVLDLSGNEAITPEGIEKIVAGLCSPKFLGTRRTFFRALGVGDCPLLCHNSCEKATQRLRKALPLSSFVYAPVGALEGARRPTRGSLSSRRSSWLKTPGLVRDSMRSSCEVM
uniref:Leucine rich repeat-containing protein n=1 Tax=Chromera velia CCMP2878 TaxID=1169474 RepID=A0A0G4HQV4_9ALVE|eukprot:Cvel_7974.t1-p1 / transcript=Cvel_7974.t1 / gene=Cvel_7974 / organism=Chromera_velia_CCMP2878 / gene_product=hypothetical protein / transcript_product=hypothetical protein / location=Cvel_scaffold429:33085-35950(-) / protein_length=597 / sequence_SO=supercontig / SO=protein_coding / is_pseudo=false